MLYIGGVALVRCLSINYPAPHSFFYPDASCLDPIPDSFGCRRRLVCFNSVHLIYPLNNIVLTNRYVPNPSPSVFRTTKNNHNILQGVSHPDLRLTKEAKEAFDAWIYRNGLRWTAEGGPLAPGGIDVAFIG